MPLVSDTGTGPEDASDLIDVVIEDPRWQAADLEALAASAARALWAEMGLPAVGLTVCILGADDGRIAVLNADFRGKPQPTNVLSWPATDVAPPGPGQAPPPPEAGDPDDPTELGDIALAYDTCAREAAEQAKSLADHVTHLIVHGLLHLMGYDHIDDADAALMEAIETRTLARMGIADPY